VIALIIALAAATPWTEVQGEVMATTVVITVPSEHADVVPALMEVFSQVEGSANEWRPGTDIARVNGAAGGEAVVVSPEVLGLVQRGVELGGQTHGAFDITWAAMWGLWDFTATTPVVPDADRVASAAELVDWSAVEVDSIRGTVRLPRSGMVMGVGGIAKGWALERARTVLVDAGVHNASVVLGGQVLAMGDRDGTAWRVGIRDPRGAADDAFAAIDVRDASVSTSGDYERFFVVDGTRYHHVLNPQTGWPARGIRSATVVAIDATTADAMSTALMVLGLERGLAVVQAAPGVEALLVDERGGVHATPGLASSVVMLHAPL
jgi:thiamine biosynthesis lipoprotein